MAGGTDLTFGLGCRWNRNQTADFTFQPLLQSLSKGGAGFALQGLIVPSTRSIAAGLRRWTASATSSVESPGHVEELVESRAQAVLVGACPQSQPASVPGQSRLSPLV